MKSLQKLFIATILLITLVPRSSRAQSYLFDWGSSLTSAWVAGNTSGNALNVGGSGINISVSMTVSGGGGFSSGYPAVNNNNSNAALFEVQGSTDAIEIDQDLNNLASFTVTTITFSKAVQNLSFGISDIDRPNGGTPFDYVDYVTVSGTGASGAVTPVLTKYNPSSTTVDVTSNVAMGNITAFGGNATSLNQGNPDQNGTVFVDFGTSGVTSITIQYGNPTVPGLRTNPRLQAIAIGNLTFLPVSSLPASFLGFGAQYAGGKVQLNWKTGSVANSGDIYVQRSSNASDWMDVPGIPKTPIGSRSNYSATDNAPLAGISYYRLKEMTNDGFTYYSKIIRIKPDNSIALSAKTYPNPFHDQFQLELNWPNSEVVTIKIIGMNGQIIKQETRSVQKGFQVFSVEGMGNRPKANYLLTVESKEGLHKINKYITQQ